eukprot:TRINITY_DN5439_c0_g2_i1.p1 TRINITY_DN5439_c0_g2~~TRINITY_DN5439_c0_g2_i1.p1  ORF type:complete len:281 (+),score=69.45 TRINITY_DN5439_c0_g2_i1:2-844(+)
MHLKPRHSIAFATLREGSAHKKKMAISTVPSFVELLKREEKLQLENEKLRKQVAKMHVENKKLQTSFARFVEHKESFPPEMTTKIRNQIAMMNKTAKRKSRFGRYGGAVNEQREEELNRAESEELCLFALLESKIAHDAQLQSDLLQARRETIASTEKAALEVFRMCEERVHLDREIASLRDKLAKQKQSKKSPSTKRKRDSPPSMLMEEVQEWGQVAKRRRIWKETEHTELFAKVNALTSSLQRTQTQTKALETGITLAFNQIKNRAEKLLGNMMEAPS